MLNVDSRDDTVVFVPSYSKVQNCNSDDVHIVGPEKPKPSKAAGAAEQLLLPELLSFCTTVSCQLVVSLYEDYITSP